MSFCGFKTGLYHPISGKCTKTKVVKYRSSYELTFCELLDASDMVESWEYEQYYIGYMFRDHKHFYLVDFWIRLKTGAIFLIEIKPKTFYERAMQQKDRNWAKWNAAISFCRNHGWKFKVITEVSIPILQSAWKPR
jgi:hypothetical protein